MTDPCLGSPIIANLFRQNLWANLATIDACAAIEPAALDALAPGTVGTIRETLWHMLNAENHFLAALRGHPDAAHIEISRAPDGDLHALREHTICVGDAMVEWAEGAGGDGMVRGEWCDGPYHVPLSMFAVQAIHHGTTHRWEIAKALEHVGAEAPDTDGWSWWESGAAARPAGVNG